MKSIKPGRGPSGMSFMGSIIAIIFGIFWTIMASSMTSGFGIVGVFFPLFGILFIIIGIVQAVYHYKNATGKDRYSMYDITDSTEEEDPANKWIRSAQKNSESDEKISETDTNYCPYCGVQLGNEFLYCPKCGKRIK
ncbi:zinc ribbon domain-containing protein [Proteiniborus sp.]|uniref:zinc ribbon domain-containing protein n=1 Tax=Proteiniborus sp. TaxID=2079015 RepID=UPI00332C2A2F